MWYDSPNGILMLPAGAQIGQGRPPWSILILERRKAGQEVSLTASRIGRRYDGLLNPQALKDQPKERRLPQPRSYLR